MHQATSPTASMPQPTPAQWRAGTAVVQLHGVGTSDYLVLYKNELRVQLTHEFSPINSCSSRQTYSVSLEFVALVNIAHKTNHLTYQTRVLLRASFTTSQLPHVPR